MTELTAKIAPATMNNRFFCAESHISPGIAVVKLAMTAPAPSEMRRAGSAQHSKVDVLPNKARLGSNASRQSPLTRYRLKPLRLGG